MRIQPAKSKLVGEVPKTAHVLEKNQEVVFKDCLFEVTWRMIARGLTLVCVMKLEAGGVWIFQLPRG